MIENTVLQSFDNFEDAYISVKNGTREDAVRLYNMMNTKADHRLIDKVGHTISVKDLCVTKRFSTDNRTGELRTYPRIILLDENGESYSTNSIGVYHSLQQAVAMFGEPTWNDPVKFEVVENVTKSGTKTLTLKAAL